MPDERDIIKKTTVTETVEYRRPDQEVEDDCRDNEVPEDDDESAKPRRRSR